MDHIKWFWKESFNLFTDYRAECVVLLDGLRAVMALWRTIDGVFEDSNSVWISSFNQTKFDQTNLATFGLSRTLTQMHKEVPGSSEDL